MAARPYWSGHIQISLVSFGVKLFTATESKSEIHFHQLSRTTGERIKYQKVSRGDSSGDEGAGERVEKSDIVKGYEYTKGQYVTIEPSDIENIRIPSRHSLEITQFVDAGDLSPEYFEKPYFVVPESDVAAEAFAVVREALQSTKKVGLGKIAFGGREHLVAIAAPAEQAGMMAYTMRYAEELRNPAAYFGEIKKVAVDADQLSLAKELIGRKAGKFAPEKFKDEYEAALRKMVEAKIENVPVAKEAEEPQRGKVINLMDALRKSVQGGGAAGVPKKSPERATEPAAAPAAQRGAAKKGISLVKGAAAKKAAKRKSA